MNKAINKTAGVLDDMRAWKECKVGTMAEVAKGTAWFCVRTHLKHEHIAAAHLERTGLVEVFHPRIRFTRSTRRGLVAFVESLFPNYVFAKFDWEQSLNLVQYTAGVAGVVHFGNDWPTIPSSVVEDLCSFFGEESVRQIPSAPDVGESVVISAGIFAGLEAVVTRVLPGQDRVAVLMDFLGRQSSVELRTTDVIRNSRERVNRYLPLESRPLSEPRFSLD